MTTDNRVYRKLQKHLNNQAVGFPATRSGAELKILKHIFNPQEAEITAYLSYQFESIKTIFAKVHHLVSSIEQLETVLDAIKRKGGIEEKKENGEKQYCCIPFVVGMYEFQIERLTPAFIRAFNAYTSTKAFGIEYLSTKLPQMRTIPISRSIQYQHHVSSYDEINLLIEQSDGPIALAECICRKKRRLEGKNCQLTKRMETCLGVGHIAQMGISNGIAREINKNEAISIIERNQKDGLILQPSNTQKAAFICSCCGCCCGMLSFQKHLPKPVDFWATNYFAVVDTTTCVGCGICEEKCQIRALRIKGQKQPAVVDLDRCLGCGVCVVNCPTRSISLSQKADLQVPPQTREALYDIIMAHKKGRLDKLLLTGKLIVDTIQSGKPSKRCSHKSPNDRNDP
jgi:ferredoxin